MIARLEEIERRLGAVIDKLRSLSARAQAVDDRVMQIGGALPPLFGPSSNLAVARAEGGIGPRSGTTYGLGTANFAVDSETTLTEGTESVTVTNGTLFTIADNGWFLMGRTPKAWRVIVPFDCDDLS